MKSPIILTLLFVFVKPYGANNIDDVRSVCPYTDLCTVGRARNFTAPDSDLVPCCENCYCDSDCWKFNDCCPDFQNPPKTMDDQMTCVTTAVKNTVFKENLLTRQKPKFPEHRLIDWCPDNDESDVGTVLNCREIFSQTPAFDDIALVSNKHNHDEIYKNKYCAACHGIHDIVMWDLKIHDCPELVAGDVGLSEFEDRIWHTCLLYSSAPTHLRFVRPLIPCNTMVDTCETTEHVNKQIKKLCEEGYYAPVSNHDEHYAGVYKNPYCYMCTDNRLKGNVTELCDPYDFRDERGLETKLTLLIRINEDHQQIEEIGLVDTRCNERNIFDPMTNKCRQLSCPWNTVVYYGTCITLTNVMSEVEVSVKFLFHAKEEYSIDFTSITLDTNDVDRFASNFIKHLKLQTCKIQYIDAITFTRKGQLDSSYLTVSLSLYLSSICSFPYISENIKRLSLESHYVTIETNGNPMPFEGGFIFINPIELMDYLRENAYIGNTLIYERHLPTYATIESLFPCPHITFNLTEYNSLIVSTGKVNDTLSQLKLTSIVRPGFFVLSKSAIGICTDTYTRYYGMATNSGTAVEPFPTVWHCFALLAVIPCLH